MPPAHYPWECSTRCARAGGAIMTMRCVPRACAPSFFVCCSCSNVQGSKKASWKKKKKKRHKGKGYMQCNAMQHEEGLGCQCRSQVTTGANIVLLTLYSSAHTPAGCMPVATDSLTEHRQFRRAFSLVFTSVRLTCTQ